MVRPTTYLHNTAAYDLWASTYDTDNNILQSLDSYGLAHVLLPRLLSTIALHSPPCSTSNKLRVTDLGCGTGRATLALLSFLQRDTLSTKVFHGCNRSSASQNTGELYVTGLDASAEMLKIARSRMPERPTIKLKDIQESSSREEGFRASVSVTANFFQYDLFAPPKKIPPSIAAGPADIIVCSLVIEHFPDPLAFFRRTVEQALLKVGGHMLLSNMHADMAAGADTPCSTVIEDDNRQRRESEILSTTKQSHNATGAGFTDPATGNKVRVAESYAHSIEQVLEAAKAAGFEEVGNVEEMKVEQWMIDGNIVNAERGKKWVAGGVKCWFGMILRLNSMPRGRGGGGE